MTQHTPSLKKGTQNVTTAYIMTRIKVGDYESWKPMFDKDLPRTRAKSRSWNVYRAVEEPDMVFIQIEFDSLADAREARERLLRSGVLDRFAEKHGPIVVERTENVVSQRTG